MSSVFGAWSGEDWSRRRFRRIGRIFQDELFTMSGKRPALPLVLTGNDLLGGHVVYHDGAGWTADLARARVARDDEEAQRLESALVAASHDVVEPYLAPVALDAGGHPRPLHYREKIRVVGPTFAQAGALDVSL